LEAGEQHERTDKIAAVLRDIKRGGAVTAGLSGAIRWDDRVIGTIRPLNRADASDEALLARLATWRNRHRSAFFTQFEATAESTRTWLVKLILDDPQRILFLVSDDADRPVGHCGARDIRPDGAEIDAILRGEPSGHRLLMMLALHATIEWLFETLRVDRIHARAFADNARAIRLYATLGMTITRWEMFQRVIGDGVVSYEPVDEEGPCDHRKVAHLELLRGDFRQVAPTPR
jgi:RimJ/RimL family protein N-acetyltransferase